MLGQWRIDYSSTTPLLYAEFYSVDNALMVVIVELYAEMLDVAFVAAMIKFFIRSTRIVNISKMRIISLIRRVMC